MASMNSTMTIKLDPEAVVLLERLGGKLERLIELLEKQERGKCLQNVSLPNTEPLHQSPEEWHPGECGEVQSPPKSGTAVDCTDLNPEQLRQLNAILSLKTAEVQPPQKKDEEWQPVPDLWNERGEADIMAIAWRCERDKRGVV